MKKLVVSFEVDIVIATWPSSNLNLGSTHHLLFAFFFEVERYQFRATSSQARMYVKSTTNSPYSTEIPEEESL